MNSLPSNGQDAARFIALHLDSHALWPPAVMPAVLACSGGLDSTVMLRLLAPVLRAAGHRLHVAHIDHGWRGGESAEDCVAVERLCAELGVDFHKGVGQGLSRPRCMDSGPEAFARSERRSFLRRIAEDVGAGAIYQGHHADDHLETLVLRHLEGVPSVRNWGISLRNREWVRPLLPFPKSALRELAISEGWTWREDSTNQLLRYRRNQIRHEILPKLRVSAPVAIQELLSSAREAKERRESLLARLNQISWLPLPESRTKWLDRRSLAALGDDLGLALLQRITPAKWEGARPPGRSALLSLLAASKDTCKEARRFDLGGGWSGRVLSDRVELATHRLDLESEPLDASCFDVEEEEIPVDRARQLLFGFPSKAGKSFALVDPDAIKPPISLITCGSGRKMRPFGMKGTKSLRDLLAEQGIPRPNRSNWPLAVDGQGRPLWLPGVRSAAHGCLQASSRRAILLYTTAVSDSGNRLQTELRDP